MVEVGGFDGADDFGGGEGVGGVGGGGVEDGVLVGFPLGGDVGEAEYLEERKEGGQLVVGC